MPLHSLLGTVSLGGLTFVGLGGLPLRLPCCPSCPLLRFLMLQGLEWEGEVREGVAVDENL